MKAVIEKTPPMYFWAVLGPDGLPGYRGMATPSACYRVMVQGAFCPWPATTERWKWWMDLTAHWIKKQEVRNGYTGN